MLNKRFITLLKKINQENQIKLRYHLENVYEKNIDKE